MITNKNAVCITVYKHRSTTMLSNLKNIDSTKFDIYIVSQENDTHKEDYKQYCTSSNIMLLYPDVTSIFAKREYIRNYMIDKGYDGFFMIDDDIKYIAYHISPETKRTTSDTYKFFKCDFNQMLTKMVDVSKEYNAGYVSIMRWGYLGWQKPNVVKLNSTLNVAQFGYFNCKLMKEYDLHYDTSGYMNEDVDMIIQMLQNGINCAMATDYMFETTNIMYENMDVTTLYGGLEDNYKLVMHQHVKYHVPLYINKKGFLKPRISYKRYWKTKELPPITDQYLYDLCVADKVNEIVEYLNNKK